MKTRIASIDIFRALTMLLMIVVNDLWTLHDIPGWLGHTEADDDGMGLADAVFPAFLFIVGLSIPFALKARLNKGESRSKVILHIIKRSLALIVMGFYMVNQDSFRSDISKVSQLIWQIAMIISFLLIWNNYDSKKVHGSIPVWLLQLIGVAGLLILAFYFKGGTPDDPQWMKPQWWGILGLIGWAYLICSLIFLAAMNKWQILLIATIGLYVLNVLEFVPLPDHFPRFVLVVSASNHALVMSGVLATVLYMKIKDKNRELIFPLCLLITSLILIVFGFAVRPGWGISKIMATPSWSAICAGISFAFFALIYLISDVLDYTRWAAVIMPAGRSALTCYLLPGIVYPLFYPLIRLLPDSLTGGWPGIIKSLIFALIIIMLTGQLERIHIKLKI